MSHTDKDRPYWVTQFQDGNGHDHDHRHGECIEETLELAQFYRTGPWRYGRHHDCNKSVHVDFTCHPGKVNGKRQLVFSVDVPDSPYYPYRTERRDNSNRPCWSRICDCAHDTNDWAGYYYCELKYNTQCFGHYYFYRDRSIDCVCDTWPERPTCDFAGPDYTRGSWRRYTWGGVPTWYCREVYHRPERAREREDLGSMRREYNAYGNIEDDDFVNRQARNSARWMWW